MTRRRVLNITSRKKCDNMIPRVVKSDGTTTVGAFTSQEQMMCLFVPNARATRTSVTNPAVRNKSETFAVGYKETVQISVDGGGTFMWRRIVFMLKGSDLRVAMDSDDTGNLINQLMWQNMEGGCNRVIGPLDAAFNAPAELTSYVFKGQEDVDWVNRFTAPVDHNRVTVKSDKVRVMRPANETGSSRTYKLWYPIRRTIVYEDDMESDVVGDKPFSTAGLRGVGDMYILDIMGMQTGGGSAPLSTYQFDPEGSYYWHER